MNIIPKIIIKNRHKRLLSMIKQNRFRLYVAMVCSLLIAATTAASAYLLKPVLDDIFINRDATMLKMLPLAVMILYFCRGLGTYGQEYFMNYVGEGIIRELRNTLYNRIQDLPVSFFQKEKTGVLMSRITNDVNMVKLMVSTTVTGTIRDFFTILGLIGLIFYLDWKMALVALTVLPLAYYPVMKFGQRVRRVSTGCQESMADMNSFLHETFSGNKIVKAFGMEPYEKGRFYGKTHNLFKLEMKAVIARSLSSPVMEFLAGLGIAFVIWFGGMSVIKGTYTAGTFIAFLAAVLMLYDPVKKLSHLNNAVQQGLAAVDRIFEIVEMESDIRDPVDPVKISHGSHSVTFRDVSFKYDETVVLHHIDLHVNPGEVLALVGMSGGGKTSLVNLLPRFYDVTSGKVLIDDIDIKAFSISSLRDQIAIVTQEPILFNDTIRNNIAYGNRNASDKEIEDAAKAAYAFSFIQGFPEKFSTKIGELGSRLSGGEKQRICIARALLKDAPILILDEATSSLDAEAEMLVQKALENLMKGRTTFVIAHRLSTIDYADRIVVLVDGEIVEEGKQEELLARKKEYYKLYHMQFNNGS